MAKESPVVCVEELAIPYTRGMRKEGLDGAAGGVGIHGIVSLCRTALGEKGHDSYEFMDDRTAENIPILKRLQRYSSPLLSQDAVLAGRRLWIQ